MLARLVRSFSKPIKAAYTNLNSSERYEKNLQIIEDDMNYTHQRISRVIRAYFFLVIQSIKAPSKTNWESNPAIKTSLDKLFNLVKHINPEEINILIVNLGMLEVKQHKIWEEIEIAFLSKSCHEIQVRDLGRLCAAFALANRKNMEIWSILKDALLNMYKETRLDPRDAVRVAHSFSSMHQDSDELFEHVYRNIKSGVSVLGMRDINQAFEALLISKRIDKDLLNLLIEHALEYIPTLKNQSFFMVLHYALMLNASDEHLSRIEEIYLQDLKIDTVFKQSKLMMNYLREGLAINENRKEFVKRVYENYVENQSDVNGVSKEKNQTEILHAMMVFPAFKLGVEVSDGELLKVYRSLNNDHEHTHRIKAIKVELGLYLRERKLVD